MSKKVLTISEARRNLPSLIKQVAEGRGPVYIGPRGEAAVALVSPADMADASTTGRRSGADRVGESGSRLNGWEALRLELVGSPEDLIADLADIRRRTAARWDTWPDRPAEDPPPVPRRRKASPRR